PEHDRKAQQPMRDPLAERPLRRILCVGMQAIVVAAKRRKHGHIRLGDGARRRDKLIADGVILIEAAVPQYCPIATSRSTSALTIGRRTVMVVPRPIALSTAMTPPCSCTMP